jgi:hypothetical protein
MPLTVTVTPGTNWAIGDSVTAGKLNLTANPTITVTGNVEVLANYSAVTPTTKTFTVQDLAGDILRVVAGHGAAQGQRVKVSNAGGALPAGLSASYEYYLRPDVTNPSTDFTLHFTLEGATNNTDRVDVTDAGTGTQTLSYTVYASGAPLVYDSAGATWEKGIVSPENLPEYVGATVSTPGVRGAVPAAAPSQRDKFLRADKTWADPTAGLSTAGNLFYYTSMI